MISLWRRVAMDERTGDQQSSLISPQTSKQGGSPLQPDPDEIRTLLGGDDV